MKQFRKYLPLILLAVGIALAFLILRMDDKVLPAEEPEHADEHGYGGAGREAVEISASALLQSGAEMETVEIRRMAVRLPLQGKIILNEDRTAHIHPRFPGVVLSVGKHLGESVRKGEVLATIESNESLRPYEVVSQMNGVVLQRHASAGETVTGDDELFTIADLSTVWVDFQVYRQDFNRLRLGQKVRVSAEGLSPVEARLGYLSPNLEAHSQTLMARIETPNVKGKWTPGLFVRGEVSVEEFEAAAVRLEAVQQLSQGPVIFVRGGEAGRFEALPVKLGRRDGALVELLNGPPTGSLYVSKNSFLLKAEIGKGEAGHDD